MLDDCADIFLNISRGGNDPWVDPSFGLIGESIGRNSIVVKFNQDLHIAFLLMKNIQFDNLHLHTHFMFQN